MGRRGGFGCVRRARQARRGGSWLCRECSAARVGRAASCAAVWPRALRLAFGRARRFQNAGGARARRVALITKLVRRAAARGRARVEHGAAAVGLHLCWRLYWFRSLWLAAARELGAVTSSGCQRTTGELRRSPAVRAGAWRSNRRPACSRCSNAKAPNEPRGIRASLRERVQESSGAALSGLTAGWHQRRGFGRPAANARLETHCSSRLARAVFRSPR